MLQRSRTHHARRTSVKPSKSTYIVDRATFVAAIVEPLVTIPQAVTIFTQRNAAGVSLSTWVGYELLTVVWIWYALVHKQHMILLYQGLFMIIQTFVIAGGLLYGAKW